MVDFFVCKMRRTRNELLAPNEIMRNFMHAASGGHTRFQNIKKIEVVQKFE